MSTPFRFKNADNTTVDFEDYYVRADYFRSGNLWLWGDAGSGNLGNNTTTNRSSPVQTIAWGSNWNQVDGAYDGAAAIKTDGTLWCWGWNSYGNLGDNTTTSRSSPVQTVTFGTNWKQVACGHRFTAAIKTDGTLWCWGYGGHGAVGDNTTASRSSPVQTITGGTNWKQVACGYSNTAAIKTDGTLWCWGKNSYYGQLGDNTTTHRSSPVQTIARGTDWKQVACSDYTVAAIKTDGTLWCWGRNLYGSLGDNTTTSRSSPVQTITRGTNWKQVSCGYSHTAAVKNDGTLWTWGGNSNGKLGWWGGGSPDTVGYAGTSPVTVSGSANGYATFFTSNTTGVSVGMGVYTSSTPVVWTTVTGISTNVSITFAEDDYNYWDGTISLGVGAIKSNAVLDSTYNKSSPIQTIAYGTNWKQVDCGWTHTSATKTDGTLWTWGQNTYGQLGDNTQVNKSSPVQTVAGGTNWKQVAACNTRFTAAIQYQDDYQ